MFIDKRMIRRLALQRSAMFAAMNMLDGLSFAPLERGESFCTFCSINITSLLSCHMAHRS